MKLIINTDGASRGNPGPASYGYIIKSDQGEILHQEGQSIGIATNNIAEYMAVLQAITYITKHLLHIQPLECLFLMDSNLVAQQLSGRFKLKSQTLKVIFDQIKDLEHKLEKKEYRYVPRKENFIADKLANIALDNLAK